MNKIFGGSFGVASIVGGVVLLIAFLVLTALWQAWAATILWTWFVVPVFAAPLVSYWQMAGIMITISAIKPTTSTKKDNTAALSAIILGPPILVGFGWLIKAISGI